MKKILYKFTDDAELQEWCAEFPHVEVLDTIQQQLEELFLIRNPSLKFQPHLVPGQVMAFIHSIEKRAPLIAYGSWVYVAWENTLVHVLPKDEYYELLTSRNKNLINSKEQEKIKKASIAVAGMSVGSSVVRTLSLEGFSNFAIADFDTLSVSNLNRVPSSIAQLGKNKTTIALHAILGINPYATVKSFPKGVSDTLMPTFLKEADIVLDEIDDLAMKFKLRQECKIRHKPLVSATDMGDSCIIDVERFDLDPKRPIFHGLVAKMSVKDLKNLTFPERGKLIGTIIGEKFVTKRNAESMTEIGKTLYTWPQLGGAATVAGGVMTYVIKSIVFGNKVKSGKYWLDIDSYFK